MSVYANRQYADDHRDSLETRKANAKMRALAGEDLARKARGEGGNNGGAPASVGIVTPSKAPSPKPPVQLDADGVPTNASPTLRAEALAVLRAPAESASEQMARLVRNADGDMDEDEFAVARAFGLEGLMPTASRMPVTTSSDDLAERVRNAS